MHGVCPFYSSLLTLLLTLLLLLLLLPLLLLLLLCPCVSLQVNIGLRVLTRPNPEKLPQLYRTLGQVRGQQLDLPRTGVVIFWFYVV
jgi:hypothetical protein